MIHLGIILWSTLICYLHILLGRILSASFCTHNPCERLFRLDTSPRVRRMAAVIAGDLLYDRSTLDYNHQRLCHRVADHLTTQ